ncbi:MAG: protein kinase [Deltaproteobacteria bacterium]|nr:protein kinase [Deltaproteobacteria bacterium]
MTSGLLPGSLFARDFRIVRRLGEGGMGRVYVVEQLSTGAQRALKVMHPVLERDERFVRRFEQEAKVGARIQSDHVVHVVAAGVDEETRMPWLAMELLEGERLSELLELRGRLTVLETQETMAQLCHGLGAAHAMGIVHRDLKPENIFLARARREGIPFTVKLLDFGIAKVLADEVGTSRSEALGSVLWMAPEQTLPTADVSAAADVWSLGLLTFRMLTGVPYWKAASVEPTSSAMVLREMVIDAIVPASIRAQELGAADAIPPGFDAWFDQCVHRDPWKRFADAGAAKVALMHVLHAAGGASPEPDPSLASRASLVDPPTADSSLIISPRSSTIGEVIPSDPPTRRSDTTGSAVLPPSSTPAPTGHAPPRWGRYAAWGGTLVLIAILCTTLVVRRSRLAGACENRDPQACRKLCDLVAFGSAHDCMKSGELFQRLSAANDTLPTARAAARGDALRAFLAACDRGVLAGCARAAVIRQHGILQDRNALRDEAAAAALLRRSCQSGKGDVDGCVQYGAALRMGFGTGRNADNEDAFTLEAAEYFRRGCDPARGGKGCFWLGYLHQYGGGGLAKSAADAEARYRQGCAGGHGDPEACNQLAEYHEHGLFTPRADFGDTHDRVFPQNQAEAMDRYDQARRLWEAECRDGNPQSCLREAMLLWWGKSENPAPDRASERLHMACDMGYAPACQRLHALCLKAYANGGPNAPNRADICDSLSLLQRACDGLWAQGCRDLGDFAPTAQDRERAMRSAESLWLASCDGGNGEACLLVAQLYAEGKPGVPRNAGRAVTYFDRACDREEPEGCKRLGDALRTGEGLVEKRPDRALADYRKACDLLTGSACYNAAQMLRSGQGAPADLTTATELFRESCDLQIAAGCLELARLHEEGKGVKQDLALARKYYARACSGCRGESQPEACQALGRLQPKTP